MLQSKRNIKVMQANHEERRRINQQQCWRCIEYSTHNNKNSKQFLKFFAYFPRHREPYFTAELRHNIATLTIQIRWQTSPTCRRSGSCWGV